jgi:hypothetical protein
MLAHEQGRVIGSRPAIEYTEKPADGELNTWNILQVFSKSIKN